MKGRMINKKKKYIFLAGLLAVFLAVTGVMVVRAVFDGDTDAVHINPDDIENSTLIIGTHLIHISVLTDELYDTAMETVKLSGQTDMYYKSELSGGTWYMISDASQLADITSADKKIENSVIRALYVRYHTKSDGVTYDLKTNAPICVFNTVDPYDLAELPQMDALKTQYESLEEKEDKSSTDEKNMESIQKLFDKGDELKKSHETADKSLEALNKFYVQNTGNADTAAVLMSVMKQVDSTRRSGVYQTLADNLLPDLLKEVQSAQDEGYVDYGLTDAISTAIGEVQDKLTEYESDALVAGENALSTAKSSLVQRLSEAAESGLEEEALAQAEKLSDLKHIESGISVNPDREADLITGSLLPLADELVKNGEKKEDLEKAFAEGEFLAKSAVSRMSEDDGKTFLENRMEELDKLAQGITDASLKSIAEDLKESSKNALNQQLIELESGSSNEMSMLLEKKQELKTEYLKALDENKLQEAQQYEEELEKLETEIRGLEKKLTDIVNSDAASSAEKAKAQAALGSSLAASGIEGIKQEILADIENSQYSSTIEKLAGISALSENSPELALAAYKEIYRSAAAKLYLGEEETGSIDGTEETDSKLSDSLSVIEQKMSEMKSQNTSLAAAGVTELSSLGEEISSLLESGISSGTDTLLSELAEQITEHGEGVLLQAVKAEQALTKGKQSATDAEALEALSALENLINEIQTQAAEMLGTSEEQIQSLLTAADDVTKAADSDTDTSGLTEKTSELILKADSLTEGGYMALCETAEELEKIKLQKQSGEANAILKELLETIEDMAAETAAMVSDGIDADTLEEILEQIMEKPFDDCTHREQAELVIALLRYGEENKNDAALTFAEELVTDCYNNDNPYVYLKLENEASEFIPLDTFAACCSYRYVYHDGNKTGILRKGTEFYEYSSFSRIVRTKEGRTEEMDTYARYQSSIYISSGYMSETFQASAEYVPDTEYALLKTQDMEAQIAALIEEILVYAGG